VKEGKNMFLADGTVGLDDLDVLASLFHGGRVTGSVGLRAGVLEASFNEKT
jgi:hypothetical protein